MYTEKKNSVVTLGTVAADSLVATGVHTYSLMVQSQIKVTRLLATITTLTAIDTVAAVVTFKRRPTHASAVGEVSMGTLRSQDALDVGKVLYKDIDPVTCYPGDEIVFEVTTAGTDSGAAAGAAVYGVEYEEVGEYVGNQGDMVESA